MNSRKNDFIVGAVITLSIIILVVGVIWLKDFNIGEETKEIKAYFNNVGTLVEGDPVKVNGVKKGKVLTIILEGTTVIVTLEVDSKVVIPVDSKIIIQNIGLMGERMVGINLGTSKEMLDLSIPIKGYFDSGIAEAMGMMGDVFLEAQNLVFILKDLIDKTIGSKEFLVTFNVVSQRLDSLTNSVVHLVDGNERKVNRMVKNLDNTVTNVKGLMDDNKDKINNISSNFVDASVATKELLGQAQDMARTVDLLLKKIQSDETSIGRLTNDTKLYDDLKATMTQVDTLLKKLNSNKFKVNVDLF